MMDRELFRQALEALEQIAAYRPLTFAECSDAEAVMGIAERAIPALRERLARQEQEPAAWRTFDGEGGYDYRTYYDNEKYRDEYVSRNGKKYASWVDPLYTAPQPRQWVGLTATEVHETEGYEEDRKLYRFARAIEAKLKEKNT